MRSLEKHHILMLNGFVPDLSSESVILVLLQYNIMSFSSKYQTRKSMEDMSQHVIGQKVLHK